MLAIKSNETYLEFGSEKNSVFMLKRKASGTVMIFKCLDAQKLPASLKNCRVTVSARKLGAGEPSIKAAPCEIHKNQFDHPGEGFLVFDEKISDLPPGDYDLEIKVEDASGVPRYFPSNQSVAFARLIVHDSIN